MKTLKKDTSIDLRRSKRLPLLVFRDADTNSKDGSLRNARLLLRNIRLNLKIYLILKRREDKQLL
jgi:hypothetical protein